MRRSKLAILPVGLALFLLAFMLPWMAGTASAAVVSAPPYAVCSTRMTRSTYGDGIQTFWNTDCNVPPGYDGRTGQNYIDLSPQILKAGSWTSKSGFHFASLTAGVLSCPAYTGGTWSLSGGWPVVSGGTDEVCGYVVAPGHLRFVVLDARSFGGAGTYTDVRIGYSISGSSGVATMEEHSVGVGGYPTQPTDYFSGGTPGLTNVAAPTNKTCSRTINTTQTGTPYANFKALPGTLPTGISGATYSWNFGDATATTTTQNPQHTYVASPPDGGWTATVTITYTAAAGYAITGTNPVTCSLRVDPLNPTQSTPSTTTVDDGQDSDCPTGFGWLNPAAIGSILKCLFIPPSSDFSTLKANMETATTKAPFSWGYQMITLPTYALNEMTRDGHQSQQGCGEGMFNMNLPGPAGNTNPSGNVCEAVGTNLSVGRKIFIGLFVIGLALTVYQTIVKVVS